MGRMRPGAKSSRSRARRWTAGRRPLFDSYEMAGPKVQTSGDIAVLTYILVRHTGSATSRWNATQVYQRKKEGWRIIHSHWSATKPSEP